MPDLKTKKGGSYSSSGDRQEPRRWWQRLNWKTFQSHQRTGSAGYYIKLLFGLGGLGFLLFTAFTGTSSTSRYVDTKLPPTSWYWTWLSHEANDSVDGGFPDDDSYGSIVEESEISNPSDSDATAISWGSDSKGRSIRVWMGEGASDYILMGMAAAMMGLLGAVGWAALIEWPIRPKLPYPHKPAAWRHRIREYSNFLLQSADNIPKLLLLIVIFGGLGEFSKENFTLGMSIFLLFGSTALFRDRIRAYLASEHYLYAIELGLSSVWLFFRHLVIREMVPLLKVQLPFMLSTFIMYEATLSYLNFSAGDISSWGLLIRDSRSLVGITPWAYWIPLASLLLVVSSLYLLGDALRERQVD